MLNNRKEVVECIKALGESIINKAEEIAPVDNRWTNININLEISCDSPPLLNYNINTYTKEIINLFTRKENNNGT